MRQRSRRPAFTTRRTGLHATVPLYLRDVAVDDDGFVTDFEIAFLPAWADPETIREAVRGSLNLDEPERVQLYDHEDRPLAGHPGSLRRNPPSPRLGAALTGLMRRAHPARRRL